MKMRQQHRGENLSGHDCLVVPFLMWGLQEGLLHRSRLAISRAPAERGEKTESYDDDDEFGQLIIQRPAPGNGLLAVLYAGCRALKNSLNFRLRKGKKKETASAVNKYIGGTITRKKKDDDDVDIGSAEKCATASLKSNNNNIPLARDSV